MSLPAALGQVVALLLRSSGRPGQAIPAPEAELDYPALLNRVSWLSFSLLPLLRGGGLHKRLPGLVTSHAPADSCSV